MSAYERERLAAYHRAAGHPERAAAVLEAGLRIWPAEYPMRYQLAQVYEDLGRPADAARAYEAFLRGWAGADPDRPEPAEARRRLETLRARG